jgi:hypothetical protein
MILLKFNYPNFWLSDNSCEFMYQFD